MNPLLGHNELPGKAKQEMPLPCRFISQSQTVLLSTISLCVATKQLRNAHHIKQRLSVNHLFSCLSCILFLTNGETFQVYWNPDCTQSELRNVIKEGRRTGSVQGYFCAWQMLRLESCLCGRAFITVLRGVLRCPQPTFPRHSTQPQPLPRFI